jgi:alpha-amylase
VLPPPLVPPSIAWSAHPRGVELLSGDLSLYAVRLSEANWTTGTNNQIAFSRGSVGFVALNNDDATVWNMTFTTGLPAGVYCNVVHGGLSGGKCTSDTVTVNSSGQATLSIPTNSSGTALVPAVAIYTGQVQ